MDNASEKDNDKQADRKQTSDQHETNKKNEQISDSTQCFSSKGLGTRAIFQVKSCLKLDRGFIVNGVAKNMGFGGSFFMTEQAKNLYEGETGQFNYSIATQDNACSTIEYNCRVTHVEKNGVGLHFTSERFSLESPIFVRRSGGGIEHGWFILPTGEPLPPPIRKLLQQKEQIGPSVVCVKRIVRVENGKGVKKASYKVYTVEELKEIQEQANRQY